MDKVLNMTYASSLTNLCEVNSSFDTGVLRICYTGENRNGSFLSKETIIKSIPTLYNCPIVCNYDRETDTLGGHDMEILHDSDGNLRIVNVTTPVGVIPESAKAWFEDYEEDDGTVHEYLYAEVLLWKRQEAYMKIKNDGITAHSMEIKVKNGESVDGVYHVSDFEFNAFALIGITPCFESSALEMFSKNDFKRQMSEMMHDLKDTFTMVDFSKENDNIHTENYSLEGGEKILKDKMNLVTQYGIDIDTLDFSIDDFTLEELTEKFEAMKNSDKKNEPEGRFALTSNLVEEIELALYVEMVTRDWGECPRYSYVDCDIESGEVYCWDRNDWLLYGFTFSMDGDSIKIDFESKKRKKYVIVDFEGGEQASPVAQIFELMENKLKDYAEIEKKFNNASDTIASMKVELDELRQFKTKTEATSSRKEVFARFEDLNGIEEYEALKENCTEFDLETLEEKCFAIRGRNGSVLRSYAKEKAPKLRVPKNDVSHEPYGGLFIKYANECSNK